MLKVSSSFLIDVSSEISQKQILILQKMMDERFLEPSQFKKYSKDNLEMLITIPLSTSTQKKLIIAYIFKLNLIGWNSFDKKIGKGATSRTS